MSIRRVSLRESREEARKPTKKATAKKTAAKQEPSNGGEAASKPEEGSA
ncbi:MAG TPA: hypothetical protein VFJ19_07305 [Nocardioidaceae bacterium]|nr:hypothetical protein [Nocardioidaceae bacterium]